MCAPTRAQRKAGYSGPYVIHRPSGAYLSVAPHHADGLVLAVTAADGHILGGAARHIGALRRCHRRRITMRPIPGNVVCDRLMMHIIGSWLREVDPEPRSGWSVPKSADRRPEAAYMVPAVVAERIGKWRVGAQMGRTNPSAMDGARPGECLVGARQNRSRAENGDQRDIYSKRHDTYQLVRLLGSNRR